MTVIFCQSMKVEGSSTQQFVGKTCAYYCTLTPVTTGHNKNNKNRTYHLMILNFHAFSSKRQ